MLGPFREQNSQPHALRQQHSVWVVHVWQAPVIAKAPIRTDQTYLDAASSAQLVHPCQRVTKTCDFAFLTPLCGAQSLGKQEVEPISAATSAYTTMAAQGGTGAAWSPDAATLRQVCEFLALASSGRPGVQQKALDVSSRAVRGVLGTWLVHWYSGGLRRSCAAWSSTRTFRNTWLTSSHRVRGADLTSGSSVA